MERFFIFFFILSLACAYTINRYESTDLPAPTLTYRELIVHDNLRRIREHNEDPSNTHKLAPHAQFLPYTLEENVQRYVAKSRLLTEMRHVKVESPQLKLHTLAKLKASMFYANDLSSYTPAVYNQGLCGNCYAFATTNSLNAQLLINGINWVDTSVQEMTDCSSNPNLSYYNLNCSGGDLQISMWYATYYGLHTSSAYPIKNNTVLGQNNTCNTLNAPTYRIKGWATQSIDSTCLTRAAAVLANYTVPTGMYAGHFGFLMYSSGLITSCPTPSVGPATGTDHAVLIVGFQYDGTFTGSYLKVKNTWGYGWGVNGFFYIAMTGNVCNICVYSVYASV